MLSTQINLTQEQKSALGELQQETGKGEEDLIQDAVRNYIDNQNARKTWKNALKDARDLKPIEATTKEKVRSRVVSSKRDSMLMNEIRKAIFKKLIASY